MDIKYVKQSRHFGSTYVHVRNRDSTYGIQDGREVIIFATSYGRSLAFGGHKYKAYANYLDTGKSVPSPRLDEIIIKVS